MSTDGHETNCLVVNIASGGVGITFDSVVRLRVNNKVMVTSPELGTAGCIVRWVSQTTAGLEFDSMTKTSRRIKDLLSLFSGDDGL